MEQNKTIGANGIKAIGAFAKRVAKEAASAVKTDIRNLLAADYYNVEESDEAYAPISSAIDIYTGTFEENFINDYGIITNSLEQQTIDNLKPGDRIILLNKTDTLNITMIGQKNGFANYKDRLYDVGFSKGPLAVGKPQVYQLHYSEITTSSKIEAFTDEEIEALLEEALTEVEAETQTLAMDEDVPEISNE